MSPSKGKIANGLTGIAHPDDARVRMYLALGLRNSATRAMNIDGAVRHDAFFAELRFLHARYPEDTHLLDELGELQAKYPEDLHVLAQLATGLGAEHARIKNAVIPEERDFFLDALRALQAKYPDNPHVRRELVRAVR